MEDNGIRVDEGERIILPLLLRGSLFWNLKTLRVLTLYIFFPESFGHLSLFISLFFIYIFFLERWVLLTRRTLVYFSLSFSFFSFREVGFTRL